MHPFMPIPKPSDAETGVPLHIGVDENTKAAYLWWLQKQSELEKPVARNDCGCVDVDLTLNFEIV